VTDSHSQKPQPSELVRQVTPKQAARAIGVSESSVKRWCDQGALPNLRTVGGHRRIPIQDLMAFLRAKHHPLVRPEELGLPATSGQTPRILDRAEEQFRQALLAGNEALARKTVLDLYLAGHHVSAICDQVIASAFHHIGDLWDCGQIEVYQERRGCDICLRCIYDLRSSLPDTPTPELIAVGGSPGGDPYLLPTTMIESVLRETGWQATSLGNDIPLASMAEAIRETRPKLFWLSVSHIVDEDAFLADYAELVRVLPGDVAVAVGGRALHESLRQRMTFAAYCDNFRHLETFAATLRRSLLQVIV
jgi:excisionase family DNA binding protein